MVDFSVFHNEHGIYFPSLPLSSSIKTTFSDTFTTFRDTVFIESCFITSQADRCSRHRQDWTSVFDTRLFSCHNVLYHDFLKCHSYVLYWNITITQTASAVCVLRHRALRWPLPSFSGNQYQVHGKVHRKSNNV